MSRSWEAWRLVGSAAMAVMLGASQVQTSPLPAWTLAAVGAVALLGVLLLLALDWRRRG